SSAVVSTEVETAPVEVSSPLELLDALEPSVSLEDVGPPLASSPDELVVESPSVSPGGGCSTPHATEAAQTTLRGRSLRARMSLVRRTAGPPVARPARDDQRSSEPKALASGDGLQLRGFHAPARVTASNRVRRTLIHSCRKLRAILL